MLTQAQKKEIRRLWKLDVPDLGVPVLFLPHVEEAAPNDSGMVLNEAPAPLFNKKPRGYIGDLIAYLRRKICKEWDYCRKRQNGEFEKEGVTLSFAIADVLLASSWIYPVPALSVAVYLVKARVLDVLCRCHLSAPKPRKRKPRSTK